MKPPGRGQSRWESPKGAIMIYSNSKSSCCFSASSCSRMYLRMVSSSKPTVLTQYPRDQKCLPFICLFFSKYRWILTALLPFKKPITNAILNFGGTLRHMWIWSALKLPFRVHHWKWWLNIRVTLVRHCLLKYCKFVNGFVAVPCQR